MKRWKFSFMKACGIQNITIKTMAIYRFSRFLKLVFHFQESLIVKFLHACLLKTLPLSHVMVFDIGSCYWLELAFALCNESNPNDNH